MPFSEIAYRGRQEASKWLDRATPARSPRRPRRIVREHAPSLADGRAALDFVQRTLPGRFFPGLAGGRSASLHQRCPEALDGVVAAAEAICWHRFDLLGYENLHLGDPIDWHRDPIANRRAPLVHWSRIDP